MLRTRKTTHINVPSGTTSRVQPLDVSVNKSFKNHVRIAFEKHLNDNLNLYTEGKLTTSERRILTTKWVADAWAKLKVEKEMIRRSFLNVVCLTILR